MISANQARGMLLEEVILSLLKKTGYKTIESVGNDDTLTNVSTGIAVKGRGTNHQIDAIADSLIQHPFSNPQRLLLEAKCYATRRKIGIDILRNAFGVLQDVNEYWVPGQGTLADRKRYHYQYAVFATSGFTKPAQEYAFAHDIYIVPLANSAFLAPVLRAIQKFSTRFFNASTVDRNLIRMKHLRKAVRNSLHYNNTNEIDVFFPKGDPRYKAIKQLVKENFKISGAFIATLGNSLPIFLVPKKAETLNAISQNQTIRIYWDRSGWYLESRDGERLFSFDLPKQLFEMYAENGFLSRHAAIDLKAEYMSTIQAFRVDDGRLRIITLKLDHDWIHQIRERLS